MSKILVTGGCGFIGPHIVESLIKRGHNIAVIDNLSTGKRENIPSDVKFYQRDITEDINDIFEIEKPEIVIHTAAQTMLRESLKDPILDAKSNVLGTINVLEACRKNNIKKLIYTSTGGARVGEPEYLPVDEKHPVKPLAPYGVSKHTAEHYVEMYNKVYGLNYLIFCFGNVYGPRDNPETKRVIPVFIDKILKGEAPTIFGDGNQTRDFIYVEDLVEFIVDNLESNPEHKLFYLANGKQKSINEVFNILKELSDFPNQPNYIGEIKGEVRDIYLNISLAKQELNWNPKHSLREGLTKTFEWFKNNN